MKYPYTLNLKFTLLLFIVFQLGFAQEDKLEEADKMFDRYAFIDAREVYLEVAEAGYKSENLFKKLGDSYYFNGDLPKSKKWYKELYELKEGNLDADYLFRYAMALKSNQNYDESDAMMLEFEKKKGVDSDSRVTKLKGERNYLELIELQSGRFSLEKTNINSELSEFSPTIYLDQMVFASNRETGSSVKRVHEWNKQPYLDLYSVKLDEEQTIKGSPTSLPKIINSKFHESSATFTKDGLTIYFTRNNYNNKEYGESEEGINFLKIYRSTRESLNSEWSEPKELSFSSDNYSIAHPALNPKETKLYFSSDMPGTLGLSDIFVVDILEDGSFGIPQNLGDNINTEGRENFPFISQNNELYFSSNGHIGLGGLDIFVSVIKDDGEYGEVFNLGRPINSSKDDFSFIINNELKKGYFASNRDGGKGEDDIYASNQIEDLITSCQQYIDGKITAATSNESLEGVTVELFDENFEKIDSTLTNAEGIYEFTLECDKKYIVRISKDDFEPTEEMLEAGSEFEKNVPLAVTIEEGDNLGIEKAGMGDDLSDLLQLDPIYFDLDKFNIRNDAAVELQKVLAVLKKYPSMKIDIRSHSDSRGKDQYNLYLSDKRAKSTAQYLIDNGISVSRVSGKGYGETQLMNDCANGVDCTEEEHALNRRSEFIILNENQTPEEVRSAIAKQNGFEEVRTQEAERVVQNTGSYDFNSENALEVYTVQIAATKLSRNIISFDKLDNVFHHKYVNDGYTRYYSGQFQTKAEANRYKKEVLSKGFKGSFVIKLKGDKRIY
ncbi:OmpA family protein [Mesonia mobilis]|uniref:Cell envelope biogenesis protein OmpA n=1 Tax=Mesonia mobilis TaxID=369791 RepID=A0ABQ3BJW7_9FLAO|nr:OmpA family protein [Mesonia mobilis]MBQ0736969.1 OmpA family protein [Aquimarina celericrescens]GGZ47913.1 cell envelope biogenesis protein OmpA [Mesonia mobilis]